jgi:serine/threonine-protein kinase
MRVSANGGTPENLIKGGIIAKEGSPIWPQMLPDGKTVLFTNITATGLSDAIITVQSLQSGERKAVVKGLGGEYISTGHIVYVLSNNNIDNLFAIPFDLKKLQVTGGPVSILEGIENFAFSESGTLVYVPQPALAAAATGAASSGSTLVWVNKQGKEEPLAAPPGQYEDFKISPDGTRVALTVFSTGGNANIWIWDLSRETMTRLTFDEKTSGCPIWTLDGKRITYLSYRESAVGGVFWKAADGTGEVEKLASEPDRRTAPSSWSKDGKTLVLVELTFDPKLTCDIGILSMDGGHARKTLLQEKHLEYYPKISPDGRWMAYQSDESGKFEVYVRPFPDVNKGKWKVSTSGGNAPLWSSDSRELFYRSGDATMAVRVETDPEFKPGKPIVLFRGTYSDYWDISPDGKRFLMMKKITAEAPRKINIVVNWFEELKQRVPVK